MNFSYYFRLIRYIYVDRILMRNKNYPRRNYHRRLYVIENEFSYTVVSSKNKLELSLLSIRIVRIVKNWIIVWMYKQLYDGTKFTFCIQQREIRS